MNKKIKHFLSHIKIIIDYIRHRLSEPSTIAGLAVFISAVYHLPSIVDETAFYIEIGVGILGFLSMVMPEHPKNKQGKID